MELKSFELINAEGKRNVKLANAFRAQSIEHILGILRDAGLEPVVAANKDICIPTCIDSTTGEVFFTRMSVSFSSKSLDAVTARKPKAKEETAIPSLFDVAEDN